MAVENKLSPAQMEFIKRSNEESLGMLCGVSTGKSVVAAMFLIKEALEGHSWIACSQTATSFAKVLGKNIEEIIAKWGLGSLFKHNKSDNSFTNEQNGAYIQGATSQSVNGLTGLSNMSGFLSDESAIIDRRTRDFLEDRCRGVDRNGEPIKPRYRYVGTPPLEGNTEWFKEFCTANPDKVIRAKTTDMIGKFGITKDFVDHQIKKYGGNPDADPSTWPPLCRAQILGEFVKESEAGKVFNDLCFANIKLRLPGVVTMGIDMAGSGRDYNVWVITDGATILEVKRVQSCTTQEEVAITKQLISKWNVRQVVIDTTGGYGKGLYDYINIPNVGYKTLGINFGQAAIDNASYLNARAEMYFQLRNLTLEGLKVDGDELLTELNAIRSQITTTGKTQLISKELIKELIGRSPDTADALALACYRRDEAVNIIVPKDSLYRPVFGLF